MGSLPGGHRLRRWRNVRWLFLERADVPMGVESPVGLLNHARGFGHAAHLHGIDRLARRPMQGGGYGLHVWCERGLAVLAPVVVQEHVAREASHNGRPLRTRLEVHNQKQVCLLTEAFCKFLGKLPREGELVSGRHCPDEQHRLCRGIDGLETLDTPRVPLTHARVVWVVVPEGVVLRAIHGHAAEVGRLRLVIKETLEVGPHEM
mmetsp:Transcript_106158/g.298464  ORF Transcript_106158/g.298464 Transcript_106158/m.298464 type:complete len:205 (+) Transcript_106158:208-822(+)